MASEPATIHRVVSILEAWEKEARKLGFQAGTELPGPVADVWVNAAPGKAGPITRFQRLAWMRTHLAAPISLNRVRNPIRKPGDVVQRGQAVIAEPVMLVRLEALIYSATARRSWIPSLCCFYHGYLRDAFQARAGSKFLVHRSAGAWLECAYGKAKGDGGERASFVRFAPHSAFGQAPEGAVSIIDTLPLPLPLV